MQKVLLMNKSIYMRQVRFTQAHRQSGATLIIVLILLILITLFGIASVRGTMLQERMVSGTISNNLAFQAAEAGLRHAEAKLAKETEEPEIPSSGCNANGYCARWNPASSDPPLFAQAGFWKKTGNDGPKNATPVNKGKGNFEIIPKYIIEDFGKGEGGSNHAVDVAGAYTTQPLPPPKLYRITAYAQAPGTKAETILQSIYIR